MNIAAQTRKRYSRGRSRSRRCFCECFFAGCEGRCASLVLASLMCVGMIKVRIIGAHSSRSLFCEFADGLIDGKSRENASLNSWQCLLTFVLNFVSELQFRIMHLALKPAHCFSVFLICICILGFVSSLSGRMFFCAPLTNRKRMPLCRPMNL